MMRIFIVSIFIFSSLFAKSMFKNEEQIENTKYINALKDLVIATQKTRGLTNSYLNGNESTLLMIYGNKKEMKKAINKLESLSLKTNSDINNKTNTINQELLELNKKALKNDSKDVFDNYTTLMKQTLLLAQAVSQNNSKQLSPLGKDSTAIMINTILPMCEYVGQLRGFGSGIVAKAKVNEQEAKKVSMLLNEIKILDAKLQSSMKNFILSKYKKSFSSDIASSLDAVKEATAKYILLTKKEILDNKIKTDAGTYFEEGTNLINLILEVYDENNKAILNDSKGWI